MSVHPSNLMLDESEVKKPTVHNPLEQFVLLAKGTKGAACTDLIKTVLEAPGVYVFAELLIQPNIQEVISLSITYLFFFQVKMQKLSLRSFLFFYSFNLQLEKTPNEKKYINTLNLFAYGTYKQWVVIIN